MGGTVAVAPILTGLPNAVNVVRSSCLLLDRKRQPETDCTGD
jgi:hypothetical protein